MIKNEQEKIAIQKETHTEYSFATVGGVYNDGLSLIFPGERESRRHYKCNTSCDFKAGQKVYVKKNESDYIVLCPIGNPKR